MFKTLEKKWNAHTPIWLHNGTKENLVFQLALGALGTLGYALWVRWEERKFERELDEKYN